MTYAPQANFPASWITPTLGANWSVYNAVSYATPAYWKSPDGFVFIKGAVKSSVASDTSTIFTLPAGYRPLLLMNFVTYCYSSATNLAGVINVGTNGTVGWAIGGNTNTIVTLTGIMYPAEA